MKTAKDDENEGKNGRTMEDEDNLAELLPPDRVADAVQRRGVQGDAHHIGNHL